jgi:squalene-associated FAD-dependent desaturase
MAHPLAGAVRPVTKRLAVIGGGWAGCAAAVQAVDEGHDVTLLEMAGQLGGRARRVDVEGFPLDNGQHILIGACTETLRLMRLVGVRTTLDMLRTPLQLIFADGSGFFVEPGTPRSALTRGVLRHADWSLREKLSLLRAGAAWMATGFRCPPEWTVDRLCGSVGPRVRAELIDPLCVAALNTLPSEASAPVFLRVLKDGVFSAAGASDLLLPRTNLSTLFPEAAADWLLQAGAAVRLSRRVDRIEPEGAAWRVDGERYDAVVLAASAPEAARLTRPFAPNWAACAAALRFEPVITVYMRGDGARLPAPMLALHAGAEAPAQFVFDHGQLDGPLGLLAFVVSAASPWAERGLEATARAVQQQAERELGRLYRPPLRLVRTMLEAGAALRCTPQLQRPVTSVAKGLWAAGDYVEGPYPATLESAVRSGVQAARLVLA